MPTFYVKRRYFDEKRGRHLSVTQIILFTEIEKKVSKIPMEPEMTERAKAIVDKKNNTREFVILYFKIYHKECIVVSHTQNIKQWCKIEDRTMSKGISYLTIGLKIYIVEKTEISTNSAGINNPTCWRKNLSASITVYKRKCHVNQRLNLKSEMLKC